MRDALYKPLRHVVWIRVEIEDGEREGCFSILAVVNHRNWRDHLQEVLVFGPLMSAGLHHALHDSQKREGRVSVSIHTTRVYNMYKCNVA